MITKSILWVCVADGREDTIYIVGGRNSTIDTAAYMVTSVFIYDIPSNTWSQGTDAPYPQSDTCAGSFYGKVCCLSSGLFHHCKPILALISVDLAWFKVKLVMVVFTRNSHYPSCHWATQQSCWSVLFLLLSCTTATCCIVFCRFIKSGVMMQITTTWTTLLFMTRQQKNGREQQICQLPVVITCVLTSWVKSIVSEATM